MSSLRNKRIKVRKQLAQIKKQAKKVHKQK